MKDDVLVGLSPVAERYIRQLESELEEAKQVATRLGIRAEAAESSIADAYDLLKDYDNYGSSDLSVCIREILRVVTADLPQAINRAERERDEARAENGVLGHENNKLRVRIADLQASLEWLERARDLIQDRVCLLERECDEALTALRDLERYASSRESEGDPWPPEILEARRALDAAEENKEP